MRPRIHHYVCGFAAAGLLVALAAQTVPQKQPEPIQEYIRKMWAVLTRSNRNLAIAAVDPKFKPPNGRWPVYVPANGDARSIEGELRRDMAAGDFEKIALRKLPTDPATITEQGLLYLPRPYVVPGGRFNEMYGWDSYFIQLGLLRDNDVALAKDMADNFLFEIRNYGKILNANRTYYLTRSQPPFLTQMLLGVFERNKDRKWLSDAMPAVESYYRFWTSAPHLTPETGLSRYYDLGEGPAPESVSAERDAQGLTHYDRVKEYYLTNKVDAYEVSEFFDAKRNVLTDLFYKGDRSMRESGFDPSNRFGPFSVDIIHYDPVCLNSLLYVMELQTAEILKILDKNGEAAVWRDRAGKRAGEIDGLMWDAQDGLYYDYNFAHKVVRRYPFLTTFYPLWVGLASQAQAAAVEKNLPKFERPGGLTTSTYESGNQWDLPFGWAPLEMIAVEGLRRYGFNADADRISEEFLSLVRDEYRKVGFIVEKYDVVRRSVDSGSIRFGYQSNQAGFGWTNAVYTRLLDELPAAKQLALRQ
ncbi:MAG TPA: trehalase family glycosidase [Bryobacteraceae bacterium]|nr:trehalase family glycosidase [Bryobacteraceae bacterium]